jgi:hypothetical protein
MMRDNKDCDHYSAPFQVSPGKLQNFANECLPTAVSTPGRVTGQVAHYRALGQFDSSSRARAQAGGAPDFLGIKTRPLSRRRFTRTRFRLRSRPGRGHRRMGSRG